MAAGQMISSPKDEEVLLAAGQMISSPKDEENTDMTLHIIEKQTNLRKLLTLDKIYRYKYWSVLALDKRLTLTKEDINNEIV